LQSPELSSFPDGNKVYIGPLSQLFGRSHYQAVTATTKPALQHDRDTSDVSDEPFTNNNGGGYCLKNQWYDSWGHLVGGKFISSFFSFTIPILTQ
jgi:hypothetical protein